MARSFLTGASYLTRTSGFSATAVPLTLVAWFRATALQDSNLLDVGGGGAQYFEIRQNSSGDLIAEQWDGALSGQARHNGFVVGGTWQHVAAVFASNSNRSIYTNGVLRHNTTNASSTPVGLSTFSVGRRLHGSSTNFFNGQIAEVAIWTAALDADEIAALAKGVSPSLIRPAARKGYWPLYGNLAPEPDRWLEALALDDSPNPTSKADHIRVYQPSVTLFPATGQVANAALGGIVSIAVQPEAALIAAPYATYPDTVLASGPRGYWRLNETSGTFAADSSGYGRHGTYEGGPTLNQPSLVSNADPSVDFLNEHGGSATPDVVDMGVVPEFSPTAGAFSIEAWCKPLRQFVNTTNYEVFGNDHIDNYGLLLRIDANDPVTATGGRVVAYTSKGGASSGIVTGFLPEILLNKRVHVVWTFSASGESWIYVNGRPSAGPAIGLQHAAAATFPTRIAGGNPFSLQKFNGVIDEVAFYSRVLTPYEVNAHWNAGNPLAASAAVNFFSTATLTEVPQLAASAAVAFSAVATLVETTSLDGAAAIVFLALGALAAQPVVLPAIFGSQSNKTVGVLIHAE